jgi:putative endonuclease
MEKQFFVYMMASQKNGTLYIGVTSDLKKRVWEHKNNVIEGFTEKYDVHDLVWYEPHENAESAITREKQMKEWKRDWKIKRIEEMNPNWNDLFDRVCE